MSRRIWIAAVAILTSFAAARDAASHTIFQAALGDSDQVAQEISTDQFLAILANKSAVVLDARPSREFAMSHIPGALNAAAKPGVPMSAYVSDAAEIARLVGGKRETPLVLYCNGPFCGKSRRLARELLAAGFSDVRRYQLGIPIWRALGGVTVIEPDGLKRVLADDRTAFLIDVRELDAFSAGSLPSAWNIPRSLVLEGKDVGEIKRAKDDGRLPMEDHNTRVIVFGANAEAARAVAEAIAHEAFHNVAYFAGTFAEARAAARP